MPRFFDDYSNTYLTHDSSAGRKQQRRGWKFRENFRIHYQQYIQNWRRGEMGLASAQQAYIRTRGKEDSAIPPLPEGWKEGTDDVTSISYYIDTKTGKRTWVRPAFIPPPPGQGPPPMRHQGGSGGQHQQYPPSHQQRPPQNFGGPPPSHGGPGGIAPPFRGGPPPPFPPPGNAFMGGGVPGGGPPQQQQQQQQSGQNYGAPQVPYPNRNAMPPGPPSFMLNNGLPPPSNLPPPPTN